MQARPEASEATSPTASPLAAVDAPAPTGLRPRDLLLVFGVALLCRALYLFEASRHAGFRLFYMDEEYNLGWARALATGEWSSPFDRLRDQPFFRAPLYSYLLSGLLRICGENTVAVRALQMLLGSVSCALTAVVGSRGFGRRIGVLAGLFCSVYWVLIYFDGEFLLPALLVFLILAAFVILHSAVEKRDRRRGALAGLAFGLFAITRPNILAFFPFLFWWVRGVSRLWPRRTAALFLLAVALGACLPPAWATIRNRVVGHDWVVVASQGGVNFYIGNNAESNGVQAIVPGTRGTWWGGFDDTVAIAKRAEGRALKPSEVSRYWFRRGFQWIASDPVGWLRLLGVKTLAWIGDTEVPNNEAYGVRRREYRSLRLPLGFGILLALFLVALPEQLRTARRRREATSDRERTRRAMVSLYLQFLAVYTFSFLAFFVTGRYRVPLVPFLAIGAGLALGRIGGNLRRVVSGCRAGVLVRRDAAHAAIPVAVFVALALALRADPLNIRPSAASFAAYNRAVEEIDAGDLDNGIAGMERILDRETPEDPEFYGALLRAYERRGRPEDRRQMLLVAEFALRSHPGNADLLFYAMKEHAEAGNWAAALARAREYVAISPGDLRGWLVLFEAALRAGDLASARTSLARAEAISPLDPRIPRMRRALAAVAPAEPAGSGSLGSKKTPPGGFAHQDEISPAE